MRQEEIKTLVKADIVFCNQTEINCVDGIKPYDHYYNGLMCISWHTYTCEDNSGLGTAVRFHEMMGRNVYIVDIQELLHSHFFAKDSLRKTVFDLETTLQSKRTQPPITY